MTVLAIAAAYLLGATITYGLCWNWFNTSEHEAELRADRPDLTDQQFTKALNFCSVFASTVLAAVWPVTAVVAAWDAIGNARDRRRRTAVDVGQTITLDGQPMLVTSIRQRQDRDGGSSAFITCTGTTRANGGTP